MPKENKVTNEIIEIQKKYAKNAQIGHTKWKNREKHMPKENKVTNEIIGIPQKYATNAQIGHTK